MTDLTTDEYLDLAYAGVPIALFAVLALVCLFRIGSGGWAVLGLLGALLTLGSRVPFFVAQVTLVLANDPAEGFDLYTALNERVPDLLLGGASILGTVLLVVSVLAGRSRKAPDRAPSTYSPGGSPTGSYPPPGSAER